MTKNLKRQVRLMLRPAQWTLFPQLTKCGDSSDNRRAHNTPVSIMETHTRVGNGVPITGASLLVFQERAEACPFGYVRPGCTGQLKKECLLLFEFCPPKKKEYKAHAQARTWRTTTKASDALSFVPNSIKVHRYFNWASISVAGKLPMGDRDEKRRETTKGAPMPVFPRLDKQANR